MDATAFVAWVASRHDDIDPDWVADANPTLVAGDLARSLRASIDAGDRGAVARGFETLRTAWLDGDDRVENTIVISCLSRVNFTDGKVPRAWARDLLPPVLRIELDNYEAQQG
ncbi:MAG TPA: hypothetical protein VF228_24325 [Iamia sp.]